MTTPAESFKRIESSIAKNPEKATSLNAIFQFDLSGDGGGTWTLDLKQGTTANWVTEGAGAASDVVIAMSAEDWTGILAGKVNPMQAFMTGKVKVKGNMGLAMKLQNILSLAAG